LTLPARARTYRNSRGLELDVPYVATADHLVRRMLELAQAGPGDILYDLGCGDGRIVVAGVRDFNVARGIGIDLDPRRIAEANALAQDYKVTPRVTFVEGNLLDFDFHDASVVTMYLLPEVIMPLRPKILALRPGTRVVSHAFDMGDWPADHSETIGDAQLFAWTVPATVAGRWRWRGADGALMTATLVQRFQDVSGTLTVDGVSGRIRRGRVQGDRLTLEAAIGAHPKPFTITGQVGPKTLALESGITAERLG
jgi:SAM-dependent methyltransferase